MSEKDDIPLSPVSEWTLKEVRSYNALMLSLGYLSSTMQTLEKAHHSPNFLLTQAQAAELGEKLVKYAANLPGYESGVPDYNPHN